VERGIRKGEEQIMDCDKMRDEVRRAFRERSLRNQRQRQGIQAAKDSRTSGLGRYDTLGVDEGLTLAGIALEDQASRIFNNAFSVNHRKAGKSFRTTLEGMEDDQYDIIKAKLDGSDAQCPGCGYGIKWNCDTLCYYCSHCGWRVTAEELAEKDIPRAPESSAFYDIETEREFGATPFPVAEEPLCTDQGLRKSSGITAPLQTQ